MRKSIIFGTLLFIQFIYGQNDPSSDNPNGMSNTASPNAAGFMRFQESAVNYYNGRSSFSIPIYEINVGGIKYPISLNYSQGGIQVNSIASDVGLGWSLTSTFVNRTVVGDADLETLSYGNYGKYGYFDYKINGYVPNGYGEHHNLDYYPDLFKFVSPSGSRRFYFLDKQTAVELDGKATKINWTLEKNKYSYLKDADDNWINNTIDIEDYKDFNLITNDGISYQFQDKEITHSFGKSIENEDSSFGNIKGTFPRVSSWNISKIKNLNNQEEINFIYESYSTENTHKIDDILSSHSYYRYEYKYPWATVEGAENNLNLNPDQNSAINGDYGRYYNRIFAAQRIKKIKFRGGWVEFSYDDLQLREDLTNGKKLTSIIVKDDNGKTIKEFELEYGYFESTVVKNEFSKRLKLVSVRKKGYNKYEFQYYEDHKLPNVGSLVQDFFGYNNADETQATEDSNTKLPKYYYYPNQNEYSILPYDLAGNSHYSLVDGQNQDEPIDKEPNELSKTWSLKSVKLPTGGTKTYVLESNTFSLWGNNLKGGGTRLQSQIIQESANGQQRTINYSYNKNTATTSGYLFNVPQAGYPTSVIPQDPSNLTYQLPYYFLLFGNAKLNYDLLNNFFIGYSKVEENEDGIKTVYEFTNDEKPNVLTKSITKYSNNLTPFAMHPLGQFLISNSSYGSDFYIDNSHKRGKPKYVWYYDKNGALQMKKENIYHGYVDHEGTEVDSGNYFFGTSIYSDPLNSGSFNEIMQFFKKYNTTFNNLTYTKTTTYLPSGNIEDVTNIYYDNRNQNIEVVSHKIGNGTTYPIVDWRRFIYPDMLISSDNPAMNHLANVINKDDTPIMIINASGEMSDYDILTLEPPQMTSKSEVKFAKNSLTSDIAMPTQALTAMGQNAFYEVGKFDRYDSKGNLLQSTKDGFSTTYLYGYNQLYPIAKIEGATYDQVMTALGVTTPTNISYLGLDIVIKSDLDKDTTSENNLINVLDTFRKHTNLANYRVTTYTYDPLIGVTSVTPPSGMREVYIYEAVTNKLKEVKRMEKDASGNDVYRTLKEYEYHYKPQN